MTDIHHRRGCSHVANRCRHLRRKKNLSRYNTLNCSNQSVKSTNTSEKTVGTVSSSVLASFLWTSVFMYFLLFRAFFLFSAQSWSFLLGHPVSWTYKPSRIVYKSQASPFPYFFRGLINLPLSVVYNSQAFPLLVLPVLSYKVLYIRHLIMIRFRWYYIMIVMCIIITCILGFRNYENTIFGPTTTKNNRSSKEDPNNRKVAIHSLREPSQDSSRRCWGRHLDSGQEIQWVEG